MSRSELPARALENICMAHALLTRQFDSESREVQTVLPGTSPKMLREQLDRLTSRYRLATTVGMNVRLRRQPGLRCGQDHYPGFFTRPLGRRDVEPKFRTLAADRLNRAGHASGIARVRQLERGDAASLRSAFGQLDGDAT
jgi:hypothetical protein